MGFWVSLFRVSATLVGLGQRAAPLVALATLTLPAISLPAFAAYAACFALSCAVQYVIAKMMCQIFGGPPEKRNFNEEKVEHQLFRITAMVDGSRGANAKSTFHLEARSTSISTPCAESTTNQLRWSNSDVDINTANPNRRGPQTGPNSDRTSTITANVNGNSPSNASLPEEISIEDHERIKEELGFKPNIIYIAIAGKAGTGKSSLVNALRGLQNKDPGAAHAGVTECTTKIARYSDERYPWIAWFDIPGAGTPRFPANEYFKKQGLYVMDCIIVLWGDRFTELDVAILKGARQWNIPALIVRSKSDSHIQNIAVDNYGSGRGIFDPEIMQHLEKSRLTYIQESRASVEENLLREGLSNHIVPSDRFLVSTSIIRQLMMKSEHIPQAMNAKRAAHSSCGNNLNGELSNGYPSTIKNLEDRFSAAVNEHMTNVTLSNPVFIDERKLVDRIFTSIARSRYIQDEDIAAPE